MALDGASITLLFGMDVPTGVYIIAVIIVLFAIGIALFIYFNRKRIDKISEKVEKEPPERTNNEILRVSGIIRMMKSQGHDTSEADAHLKSAERALKRGDEVEARTRAGKAKDVLMNLKKENKTPGVVNILELPEPMEGEDEEKTLEAQLMETVPENYMESKFAITNARNLIECIESSMDKEVAQKELDIAKRAFDDEEYQDAFVHACRARRLAGIEGIKLKEKDEEKDEEGEDEGENAPPEPSEKEHADESEERVTEAKETLQEEDAEMEGDENARHCQECGKKVLDEDKFCRNCGAKLDQACSECGTVPEPGDKFCRNCGTKF